MQVAEAPATREELGAALASAAEAGTPVRFRGAGTKQGWPPAPPSERSSSRPPASNQIVEHNAGDLTAVLEPGVRSRTRRPCSPRRASGSRSTRPTAAATVGGVVASGDTGPLRGRYGGPRDLVVGMRVALSDGTLAKSGGKVIKNVAGYDIAKLFTGSFGTLGAIVELSVRLHPIAPDAATALGERARSGRARARRPPRSGARRSSTTASTCAGAAAAAASWRASRAPCRARRPRRPSGCCAPRAWRPRSSTTTTRSGTSSAPPSAARSS